MKVWHPSKQSFVFWKSWLYFAPYWSKTAVGNWLPNFPQSPDPPPPMTCKWCVKNTLHNMKICLSFRCAINHYGQVISAL